MLPKWFVVLICIAGLCKAGAMIQENKKVIIDYPEEINQCETGDTLYVISRDGKNIVLGFKKY